jgi:hypothetical protein
VFIAGDYQAASVWIAPGGSELTEQEEDQVELLLAELVGSHAASVMELLERFEASHPRDRPHYYLRLLGTHPDSRGRGLGGSPESSNPDNDARYERLGFKRVGEFSTPDRRHTVATMWRDPRPKGTSPT